MSAEIDKKLLQHIGGLTAFEVNTIGILVKNGGEVSWRPATVKPITLDLIEHMITDKRLVEVIERIPHGLFLRLTDRGRQAADQIDRMNVAPKVEIVSP